MPSPNNPVGQSIDKPIAEDRAPGPVVQSAGSLATDPEQKRRIIAGQLFPNLSPTEAQSRVFYGPNGRMAAVGLDGQPYYVDPDKPDISALRTFSPSNLASNIGGLVGPSFPAAGGVIGGAAAAPADLIVGPLAAGAGAGAGDIVRQLLAARLDPGIPNPQGGAPTTQPYDWRQTAGQAIGAAGGQAAGASLLRVFAPNRLGLSSTELDQLRRPGVMDRANQTYDTAQTGGVTLSPGQATNLPSLLSKEDVLASGSAGSDNADIAATFYGGQRQQLNQLYQNYLDNVSPATDKTDAAMQFQQGAEDATRIVRQDANTAARPSYQQAQAGGQVMSPDLAQLADTPAVSSAMQKARADYANLYRTPPPDTPDFALWDLTKRNLDDQVSTARRAGENTTAMATDSLRGDLVTHLDAAYPSYATARDLAAPGQRLSARLQSSLGQPGAGDETARAIVAPVFNTNNPRAISEARDAFTAAGRGDEWSAGTRAYLQDAFDKASTGPDGLNPANLRKQIWGNANTQAAMRAALTPEQFQGLDNVMGTLEAVARSKGINSLTTPRAVGGQELQAAASNTPGVGIVRGIGNMLSPRLLYSIKGAADNIADWMTARNVRGFATRIFGNPEQGVAPDAGMNFLRQAARLSPGSRELVQRTAEFLGQQGGSSDVVSGTAPTPGTNPPGPGYNLPPAPRNQFAPIYGP
jgi:hypothetical protein